MIIINELNNREIALILWLIIFIILALTMVKVRQSIIGLIKTFFHSKLIFPIFAMLIFIIGTVAILRMIGFWDISALNDTIYWTIGTAFVTFFNLDKVGKEEKIFKNLIVENIKFIVILEFIINLYTFSLLTELIVLPIIVFLYLMVEVSALRPEQKQVRNLFTILLAVFGGFVLVFTIKEIFLDFQSFASLKNLRDLLLPPLLLVMFIPFLYFVALYMHYDSLFKHIGIANKQTDLLRYTKKKIFMACHINLFKLIDVKKKAGFPKVIEKRDVLDWIEKNEGKSANND